jgi:hypothetical protein
MPLAGCLLPDAARRVPANGSIEGGAVGLAAAERVEFVAEDQT